MSQVFCEFNFHEPNLASVSIDLALELVVCVCAYVCECVRVCVCTPVFSGLESQQLLMIRVSLISLRKTS